MSTTSRIATQRIYAMLGNESLWEVAIRCTALFQNLRIDHSICGGVAVCLHGYQRNTIDIDFIISSSDSPQVKQLLLNDGFHWDPELREFRSPSGVIVQFLIAGEKLARDTEMVVPEPKGDLNVEQREGLSVVKLSKLIEMKLASGLGNLRRTHKDFADVVELIAIRKLDASFARFLHSSLRTTFRDLVHHANADD